MLRQLEDMMCGVGDGAGSRRATIYPRTKSFGLSRRKISYCGAAELWIPQTIRIDEFGERKPAGQFLIVTEATGDEWAGV